MKNFIKKIDRKLLAMEMLRLNIEIPERYQTNFIRVSGAAEFFYLVEKLTASLALNKKPEEVKCLIIGVFGGRDYWGLKNKGFSVFGLDLEEVADCPGTKKGDAETTWPYADQEFDLVVMGEVLEHLFKDMDALKEAKRVLKPNGKLLVTVPFCSTKVNYHVRMHDKRTIKRLLSACNFKVEDYIERPGFLSFSFTNYLNCIIAVTYYLLFKKSIYHKLTRFYGYMEWKLGHIVWLPRWLLKSHYGATLYCSIEEKCFDYKTENLNEFIQQKKKE